MIDLPEPLIRLLHALAVAPKAWRTPNELAESIGVEVEEATDRLASLDSAGWVEVWERPEGVVVTLSPLAAERLALRLVEIGPEEVPRWAPSGDPEPPAPRARHVCNAARAADLEFVVDPHELPESAVERAELTARRADVKGSNAPRTLPWPTLVVGQGVSPWREVRPGPACPGCGGERLRSNAYCLCCGRWGLDAAQSPSTTTKPTMSAGRFLSPPNSEDARRSEQAMRTQRLRRKMRRLTKQEVKASVEADSRKRGRPCASAPIRAGAAGQS